MVDVERLLRDFRVNYATSGPDVSQGWIGVRCPWCNDHGQHLGICLDNNAVSCWKCGAHKFTQTVAKLIKVSDQEAWDICKHYGGIRSASIDKRKKARAAFLDLPDAPWSKRAQEYLASRFVTEELIMTYDLRYGGPVGFWAHRIIIPVYVNGVLVSATGRTIHDAVEPRYLNNPIEKSVIDMKHTFLGLDLLPNKKKAVVVEGPFDAIKGGPGFISGFGATLTKQQLLQLSDMEHVTIMFDADDTGRRKADLYAETLASIGIEVDIMTLASDNGYKDLGAMPVEEIISVRKALGLEV